MRGVERNRIHLDRVGERRIRFGAAAQPAHLLRGGPVARSRRLHSPEIVETDVRRRQRGEDWRRRWIQVAQEPVADAAPGHGTQLLLRVFEHPGQRLVAEPIHTIRAVRGRRVEPDGIEAREPADGA